MLTYEEAEAKVARSRSGAPKLGNNTYLETAHNPYRQGVASYGIRYHATLIVYINDDGTYTLANRGWNTITTNQRLNSYTPARVYSDQGDLYVWHPSDPRTPEKIQKCRVCHGSGQRHIADSYDYWKYENGKHVRLDPPVLIPAHDVACYRCGGSGRMDYGSKPDPWLFRDGITVGADGKVIPTHDDYRKSETEDMRRERERIRAEANRAQFEAWLVTMGIRKDDQGDLIMYKAVRGDLKSAHGTLYEVGTEPEAPDYKRSDACGNGLHFSPSPALAQGYDYEASRYLECAVDHKSVVWLNDKVKARKCKVLREVGYNGQPVEDAPL